MKRNILVISRENCIGHMLEDNFMDSLTTVLSVRTSTHAMEMIMQETYSLIILDVLIQDMDGSVLLQIIRKLSRAPLLVLTKQLKIQDRIKILNLGADDCLVWPADTDELIVRMEACMKRGAERLDLKPVLHKNIGLLINPCKRTVEIKSREIVLTKREFDILLLLASNPGVVFSKEQIYAAIWNGKFVKDGSNIMSYIGRLRKKIGLEAGKNIQTVWGIGYRFAEGDKEADLTV